MEKKDIIQTLMLETDNETYRMLIGLSPYERSYSLLKKDGKNDKVVNYMIIVEKLQHDALMKPYFSYSAMTEDDYRSVNRLLIGELIRLDNGKTKKERKISSR